MRRAGGVNRCSRRSRERGPRGGVRTPHPRLPPEGGARRAGAARRFPRPRLPRGQRAARPPLSLRGSQLTRIRRAPSAVRSRPPGKGRDKERPAQFYPGSARRKPDSPRACSGAHAPCADPAVKRAGVARGLSPPPQASAPKQISSPAPAGVRGPLGGPGLEGQTGPWVLKAKRRETSGGDGGRAPGGGGSGTCPWRCPSAARRGAFVGRFLLNRRWAQSSRRGARAPRRAGPALPLKRDTDERAGPAAFFGRVGSRPSRRMWLSGSQGNVLPPPLLPTPLSSQTPHSTHVFPLSQPACQEESLS